jgi:AcrR family transcriptional regulator
MPRPRSEEAHLKVLEASLRLFAEQGIDATSMDAVAAESGVSKATIYKHWPDKDALALEVLVWLYRLDERPGPIEHKNLREDLIAALNFQPVEERSQERERIMPHLIAYSARNVAFGKAWRAKALSRHSVLLKQVLESAIERGEVRAGLSLDTAVALLFGPMMYRKIFVAHSRDEKVPPEFVEAVVDAFMRAHAKGPRIVEPAEPRPLRRAR